jgi:PAS domain-containing protein
MAETFPLPTAIIDEAGRCCIINQKFTDLFGYPLDDVPYGRRWFGLAYPDPGEAPSPSMPILVPGPVRRLKDGLSFPLHGGMLPGR